MRTGLLSLRGKLTRGKHQHMSSDESKEEQLDRELIELLNELRVALPGVQVLFAFLLGVPFTQRFGQVRHALRRPQRGRRRSTDRSLLRLVLVRPAVAPEVPPGAVATSRASACPARGAGSRPPRRPGPSWCAARGP